MGCARLAAVSTAAADSGGLVPPAAAGCGLRLTAFQAPAPPPPALTLTRRDEEAGEEGVGGVFASWSESMCALLRRDELARAAEYEGAGGKLCSSASTSGLAVCGGNTMTSALAGAS